MIAANRAQRLSAGMLALGVHGLFLLALMFGVSWRSLPDLPVYADLWDALPSMPQPPAILPALPEAPPPQRPVPAPPPPAPAKPDISLSPKAEPKPAAEKPPEADAEQERERQAQEQRQREAELAATEARRQAQEQARLDLERELAQQAQSDMARELETLRRTQQAQSARSRLILEHRDAIRDQIHQYLRPCPKVPASKEVVFAVQLLPSGDLKRLQLLQSSGSDACDGDVERAIRKAFPMPLPQDREAARAFTRESLELRLRPNETPASEGRG